MFIQTIQNHEGEATVIVMSKCMTELLYTISLRPSGPYLVLENGEEVHMSEYLNNLPLPVMFELFSAMVDVISSIPKVDRTKN